MDANVLTVVQTSSGLGDRVGDNLVVLLGRSQLSKHRKEEETGSAHCDDLIGMIRLG
jgi:hypothetical protein